MKKQLCLIAALLLSASAFGADAPAGADPKMQEMMQKMKEFGTPGAPHKRLAEMAGKWTYTSKFWDSANAKPHESKGRSTMKMIMGGRWMQHEAKGQIMGAPWEGMGLTGYDNLKGKYETLWFDSMSTGVVKGEGTFDEATKTLKDSGQYSCPMTAGKTRTYRGEWKIVDKNNSVYTMYGPGPEGGAEFKQMEMTFKRVQ